MKNSRELELKNQYYNRVSKRDNKEIEHQATLGPPRSNNSAILAANPLLKETKQHLPTRFRLG